MAYILQYILIHQSYACLNVSLYPLLYQCIYDLEKELIQEYKYNTYNFYRLNNGRASPACAYPRLPAWQAPADSFRLVIPLKNWPCQLEP